MKKNKEPIKAVVLALAMVLGLAITSVHAGTKVEKLINDGHKAYQNMDYEKAIVLYEMALESDPVNVTALKYCAYACRRSGNNEAAIKYLKELYAITMAEKIMDQIVAIKSEMEFEAFSKEESDDKAVDKTYRHLVSVNAIPWLALFTNLSYEFMLGDYVGLRLVGYAWIMSSGFSGITGQIHYYPQGRGLAGWLVGGGVGFNYGGYNVASILPSAQAGYRWIGNEGFSVDVMLGAIYIGGMMDQSYFGHYYIWPSVELNIGYAF